MPQFSIAGLLTFFATFSLAVFVFFYNRRSVVNRIFCIYSLSISEWSLFTALHALTDSQSASFFSARIMHLGVPLIPVLFYHFCLVMLNSYKRHKSKLFVGYLISVAIIIANFTSSLIVLRVRPKLGYHYFMDGGSLYPLLIIIFSIYTIMGLHLLLKAYLSSAGNRRNQLKYLFWGSLIGYAFGFSCFLPVYNITILPYPFGSYAIALYVGIAVYAIVKYRLMDINIAFTRAGIFAIVYALVLGFPFLLGYKYGLWQIASWVMLFLATLGPFIYLFLKRHTEDALLKDQKHNHMVLTTAARSITLVRNLDKLLNLTVRILTRTLGITHASIYLFDRDTNQYRFHITRGGKADNITIDFGNSLIKYLQGARKPIIYEEIKREYEDRRDVFIKEMVDTMNKIDADLLVPSFIETELIGFLALGSKRSGKIYSNEDLNVLSNLANQSALAIENAKFLKEREQMQEKLRKAGILVAMSELLATFEHEVGNILGKISAPIQAMAMGDYKDKPDKEKKAVDMINTNVAMMRVHVRYVREYREKNQAHILGIHRLVDCIQRAFDHSRSEIEKLNITTEVTFISSKIMIKGIETLPDIFKHLVVSSVNGFGMEAGELIGYRARLLEDKGMVEITQEDTGFDLTQETKNHKLEGSGIFFERGKLGGINLYLAQQIVSDHKGSFEIQSSNGKGTRFVIRLPLDFTKVTI